MTGIRILLLGTAFVLGLVGVMKPSWPCAALGVSLLAVAACIK